MIDFPYDAQMQILIMLKIITEYVLTYKSDHADTEESDKLFWINIFS